MAPRLLAVLTALAAVALPAAAEARTRDLRAFGSCDQLLGYARANATRMAGTGWVPPLGRPVAAPGPAPVPGQPLPAAQEGGRQDAATSAPAPDVSTTNVQEEGVDEADVVKTDGKVLYAVANGVLHVVDVRATPHRMLGTLTLAEGAGHELLLHGDRLLVLQNAALGPEDDFRSVARLTEVDVRDPASPRVLRTDRVDGSYVTARQTGDMARIVIGSPARAVEPLAAVTGRDEAQVRTRRRAIVRRARLAAWRPRAFSRDRGRGRAALYPIVPCREVRRPRIFSGLDTVTVLTIDLDRGLPAVDADAIMADAGTVYGSPTRLYVASSRWLSPQLIDDPRPPPLTTQIHAFDVSRREATTYVGSGRVSGFLLNQFALSEHRGRLRVASTDVPQWWGAGAPAGESESFVTVLDRDTLAAVGRVGGLGRGERIFAVRFIDDVGYVVTFRQVDPLYTVDLSNAAAPRVAGELKVQGYSAYLHPVGENLILGVGQDADAQGGTRGVQLSLFDVADPARPARVATRGLGSTSSSAVEFDHRAFLWWGARSLAVVPVAELSGDGRPFVGAVGFGVTRGAIDERGRMSHPAEGPPPVTRSVVVGDRLFTLSDRGVLAGDLATLAGGAWLPFSEPAAPAGTDAGRTRPQGARGTP